MFRIVPLRDGDFYLMMGAIPLSAWQIFFVWRFFVGERDLEILFEEGFELFLGGNGFLDKIIRIIFK